jgi:exoribonuclease R
VRCFAWRVAESGAGGCRYQEAPTPPTPEQLGRLAHSKLAQSYLWRTRMLKSGTTADLPRKHHGLGIDAYCQVTSPIRRCAAAVH